MEDPKAIFDSDTKKKDLARKELLQSGPVPLVNKIYTSLGPAGLRLAFAEQFSADTAPQFRAAVSMSLHDAIAPHNLSAKVQLQQLHKGDASSPAWSKRRSRADQRSLINCCGDGRSERMA